MEIKSGDSVKYFECKGFSFYNESDKYHYVVKNRKCNDGNCFVGDSINSLKTQKNKHFVINISDLNIHGEIIKLIMTEKLLWGVLFKKCVINPIY